MSSENEAAGQDRPNEPGESGQKTTVPRLADIAADWGCSVPYVSKMKSRGCPVDSLESARRWRAEHSGGRGAGYRSKRKEEAAVNGEIPGIPAVPRPHLGSSPQGKNLKSLQSSLKGAISVEQSAMRLVDDAMANKRDELLSVRIAAYNKARDGRYDSEKVVQEILQKNRTLIPLDEAKRMVGKVLGTIFSRLRAVPRRAAPKANPVDDVLAEEVIRIEIEAAIAETHTDATLSL